MWFGLMAYILREELLGLHFYNKLNFYITMNPL